MSLWATAWAWEQKQYKPRERMTLLALVQHIDADNKCWPRIKRLAEEAGLSPRSVAEALSILEADGVIRREHRQREDHSLASNMYFVAVPTAPFAVGVLQNLQEGTAPFAEQNLVQENLVQEEPKNNNRAVGRWKKIEDVPGPILDGLRMKFGMKFPPGGFDNQVDFALSHKNAKNYDRQDLYLDNWLSNARDLNQQRATGGNRATTTNGAPGVGSPELERFRNLDTIGTNTPRVDRSPATPPHRRAPEGSGQFPRG